MTLANAARGERINLRLSGTAKRRIEQAASVEGKTVSGFILSCALENAKKTIEKYERMVLGRRDAELFFDAVANPPAPNDELRTALDEHGRRVVSR